MKKSIVAALCASLCATISAPAYAAMDNIGTVSVDNIPGRTARSVDLGGPVDRLGFTAQGSNVDCRAVNAQFGNGTTSQVFSGKLYEGRSVSVDLPGDRRNITRLAFNCVSQAARGATIRVSADIGTHRAEWQRNPNFARLWARLFNWGNPPGYGAPPPAGNSWQYLGATHFSGGMDTDGNFAGWNGHRVTTVGLKPSDADARCSKVIATFGNGTSRDIGVNRGDFLRRGTVYKLDLPGDQRNLVKLVMRCRATNARSVTIQVYAGG